jgi:DNA-binding transcriptional LysR family regulator
MRSNIEWEWYRSFLGVLRSGSLSGAARQLGVAQPTVGRHIAALEAALGMTLFTRSQNGLLPTDAALALRPHAEAMEHTAAALERAASGFGNGVRGAVRVTASEVIGVEVLPPILRELHERYPELRVELVLSNSMQDLLGREADIAVRMVAPRQDQLVARRVGSIGLGLHASRAYLERHGVPSNAEELGRHALIGYDSMTPFVRQSLERLPPFGREYFAFRTDGDLAHLALIRAGAGIGFCQLPLARREPALEQVLAGEFALELDTWVAMHEDLRGSPRCRVTFDALAEGLLAYTGGAW